MKDIPEEPEIEAEALEDVAEGDVGVEEGDVDQKDESDRPDSDEDEGELVVTIGDEAPAEDAEETPVIRDIRKKLREAEKRAKAAERKLEESQGGGELPALREKPKDPAAYDSDEAFADDLEKWFSEKLEHDKAAEAKNAERKKSDEQWAEKVHSYTAKRTEAKYRGFEDAEATVIDAIPTVHQSIIVAACKDPVSVVYALGTSPSTLERISKITDPVTFAYEIGGIESKMKVSNRKAKTTPEARVSGTASGAGSDKTLERLEAEADRTGDRTKVLAYKRKLKSQS